MESFFNYCESLNSVNLSKFDTSKVTSMNYMFYNCRKLTSLNIASFDTQQCKSFNYIFENCNSLKLYANQNKCNNLISSLPSYVTVSYVN